MTAPFLLVRDGAGVPQPPEDLVRRLAALDPLLHVQYWAAAWRIFRWWGPNDPRHARVQAGEVAPESAHDIVGQIPAYVPIVEAAPYLERELRGCGSDEVRKIADKLAEWNSVDAGKEEMEATIAPIVEATAQALEPPRTKGKRVKHPIPKG